MRDERCLPVLPDTPRDYALGLLAGRRDGYRQMLEA
jgi:hypothetical protein